MRETLLHCNDYFMVGTFAQCGSRLLLIHGHTHRPDVWKAGLHLIIRQGEVCRHLTGTSTVAIVDAEKRGAEIVELEESRAYSYPRLWHGHHDPLVFP